MDECVIIIYPHCNTIQQKSANYRLLAKSSSMPVLLLALELRMDFTFFKGVIKMTTITTTTKNMYQRLNMTSKV